ncbi:MAG: hypothetical protein IKW81_11840 [Pseudobutyrivibrio sp.]|nr:hypothetical protein [Pseudobutyrivibrio sp.]
MINEENIIDLSDFAERDIKEEFTRLKDSISALEKLIDAKEQEQQEDGGVDFAKIQTTIKENVEEISLPLEQKCDVLEAKLNILQETINQSRSKQDTNGKLVVFNTIGIVALIVMYVLFYLGF